jgi:cytochrome c oxidase subunit 3
MPTSSSSTGSPGSIVPLKTRRARSDTTAWIGMIVFLASWVMLFAALFFVYGILRVRAAEWPPGDLPRLPIELPGLNTAVLVASSVLLHVGLWGARVRRTRVIGPSIGLASLLGALFLVLQVVVYSQAMAAGLTPQTGPYPSVLFGLTLAHAIHVAVGIIPLAVLSVRGFRGAYTPARHLSLRLWTMYWHFVGIVWVLMYVLIYVI